MTVAENVGYAPRLRRLPRKEWRERVAEALNALRIDSLAGKRPDELSGLQRQRVALAQIEASRQAMRHWSRVRAEAVQELKQGRTWAQVAELLGVSEPTAWNIAHPKS